VVFRASKIDPCHILHLCFDIDGPFSGVNLGANVPAPWSIAPGNGIPEPQWQSCGGRPESDQASQGPPALLLDTLPWGNLTKAMESPLFFRKVSTNGQ